MKITIDASQAAKNNKTGIENFSYQLICQLIKQEKSNQFILLTNKPLPGDLLSYSNSTQVLMPFPKLWNKIRLPLYLLFNKTDIFFSPGYMLPPFAPKNSVAMIHDLAFKHFPKSYSAKERIIQDKAIRSAYHKSRALLFLTQNTLSDFENFYPGYGGIKEVIHLGYDQNKFKIIDHPKTVANLRSKYILCVGRLEEKKNIINIIKSYKLLRSQSKIKHKLVFAGKKGYKFDKIQKEIDNLGQIKKDVILLGYVSDEKLPHLYAKAEMLVFCSHYEGFGIPLLEAFSVGTPVVCSNNSSFPEITGSAALSVNPNKPYQIAVAMSKIINLPSLKSQLVSKGFVRASKYSWQKCADKVIKVFDKLMRDV